MATIRSDKDTKKIVRSQLHKLLGDSGLLEYSCRTPKCRSQVFSTWEVNLTCNDCGKRLLLPDV